MVIKSPFHPGDRLAAYLRDSGGEDQDLSLSQQESAIRDWAGLNGLALTHFYRDEAIPGSSTIGRAAFQDMIHHFHSPCDEKGVVVWNYQRFSRSIDDSQFFRADLRRRGFIFFSLNDEIPEGAMGRFFEAALDWKNEQFLLDLSKDVKRGLANLAANYGALPGRPPVGFIRQPVDLPPRRDGSAHTACRWVPDPELLPRIRLAWQMRAAGRTLTEIQAACHLYSSHNGYNNFFRNRLYLGILAFSGQTIEHYCDPIIDQATWDAVQAIIERNATHQDSPRRKNSRYLLSGLARCGRCDSPLAGSTSVRRPGLLYDKYVCTKASRHGGCDMPPIPRKVLETAILGELRDHILSIDQLTADQALMLQEDFGARSDLEHQRQVAGDKLAAVLQNVINIAQSIATTGSQALNKLLMQLEAEETTLRSEIASLDRQLASIYKPLTLKQLKARQIQLLEEEPRAQIQSMISHVIVDRDGGRVFGQVIYFHPPQSTSTGQASSDAIIRRHTFACGFSASMRSWTRRK